MFRAAMREKISRLVPGTSGTPTTVTRASSFVMAAPLTGRSVVSGWATIMVAMLFLGSVQLICLGILGEYLGRVFNEVKPRPMYVVEELIAAATPERRDA